MAVDFIVPFTNLDQGGIVVDSDPFTLSNTEFSNGRNVRFDNRVVSKISGEEQMISLDNSNPVSLTYWRQPANQRYVYHTSNGNSYLANATGTDSSITGTTALSTSGQLTGGLFNGGATYIVNDGANIPQYINAIGFGVGSQQLVDLPGWAYDSEIFSSVRAGVLRPYRNVLVAGNLTFTQTNNQVIYAPGTIRVSNLAERGVLPTWDPQLAAANTAEEFDLATNDAVVDMVPLADSLIIYCANSVHTMRLTGSNSLPVSVSQSLSNKGLLSTNCAVEFYGRHFVVGVEDIYTYSGGQQVQSVSDSRVRDYFFDNLNMAQKDLTFVQHNPPQDELWICYPKGTSTTCNEALIYNYVHNNWTIRDLPNILDATEGALVDDFSSPTEFEDTLGVVMLSGTNLRVADRGTSFNGSAIDAFVERRGINLDPNNDMTQHNVKEVWMIATGSGTLSTAVRAVEAPGRPVNLQATNDRYLKTRDYELSGEHSDYKVTPNTDGRYFNIRIGSNDTTSSWDLISFQVGAQGTDNR